MPLMSTSPIGSSRASVDEYSTALKQKVAAVVDLFDMQMIPGAKIIQAVTFVLISERLVA